MDAAAQIKIVGKDKLDLVLLSLEVLNDASRQAA